MRARENERAENLWAEYLANERLHPFTVEGIAHTIEMFRIELAPFLGNPVIATIPERFAECVRRQEEIDDTGREITADDWGHSYRSIQIDLVTTPRSLPAPPVAAGQRSGIPSSFLSFVARQRANGQAQQPQSVLSDDLDLLNDVNRYNEYINDGARFGEGWSWRFAALYADVRYDDIRRFDFVPGGRLQSFRKWLDGRADRLAELDAEGPEPPVSAWLDAIISYAAYLSQEEDATPDHLRAFVVSRLRVAASDRQRLNEFRPAPPFNAPGPAAENELFLDFRQWIVREYQDDSLLAWSRTTEEALAEDMDFYERYLRANGTQSQLNEFRLLRANVAHNIFSFTPPASAQRNSPKPSFHTWFEEDNHYRRSVGESEMTFREGLQNYPIEAALSPEEENDFTLARDRHFEENRRQMYGFARGSYSQVVEGLRTARDTVQQLRLDSLHYWPDEECGNQYQNPVLQPLVHVNQALQRFIAMEESPPDEVWHDIMSEIRRAESLVIDADRRARDEVVDEMARAVMRRTLETVREDTDAFTVTSSRVIPRSLITAPSGNALDDDFPPDQPVSPSDLQTGIGTRGSIFMN